MPAGPAGFRPTSVSVLSAAIIIDAHGSWEASPGYDVGGGAETGRVSRHASDLFAFKARFRGAALAPDLLSVLAFPGGYGGIVVADGGNTTLACCVRRDVLRNLRAVEPGRPAGLAVEALLTRSCEGVRLILRHAQRDGAWLSVGPIRPGIRLDAPLGVFRVGNAAGESHPLIGEGISMALQSAKLLADELTREALAGIDAHRASSLQLHYGHAWRKHFAPRLRLASLYANVAMRPRLAARLSGLLGHWPGLLTEAARFAGKARDPIGSLSSMRGTV
jgi:2-polyprenyl-6-methoxyphenol hydroxylase-like FAD-dependent oxidoreductase